MGSVLIMHLWLVAYVFSMLVVLGIMVVVLPWKCWWCCCQHVAAMSVWLVMCCSCLCIVCVRLLTYFYIWCMHWLVMLGLHIVHACVFFMYDFLCDAICVTCIGRSWLVIHVKWVHMVKFALVWWRLLCIRSLYAIRSSLWYWYVIMLMCWLR